MGRVAVPVLTWQKPAPLTPDEWEQVRLHAYHTERVLSRSPFLAALGPVATTHHAHWAAPDTTGERPQPR